MIHQPRPGGGVAVVIEVPRAVESGRTADPAAMRRTA
jgi:hypothetical protein